MYESPSRENIPVMNYSQQDRIVLPYEMLPESIPEVASTCEYGKEPSGSIKCVTCENWPASQEGLSSME
jgi:hypothetical protein